jgi:hypothetical protein
MRRDRGRSERGVGFGHHLAVVVDGISQALGETHNVIGGDLGGAGGLAVGEAAVCMKQRGNDGVSGSTQDANGGKLWVSLHVTEVNTVV